LTKSYGRYTIGCPGRVWQSQLHRADFGSLYLTIYEELGDEQQMKVIALGV